MPFCRKIDTVWASMTKAEGTNDQPKRVVIQPKRMVIPPNRVVIQRTRVVIPPNWIVSDRPMHQRPSNSDG
jgi:hypothetical protein